MTLKIYKAYILMLAVFILCPSCTFLQSKIDIEDIEKKLKAGECTSLYVSGNITLDIQQTMEGEPAIDIKAEDKVLEKVEISIDGSVLTIKDTYSEDFKKGKQKSRDPVHIMLKVPQLQALKMLGRVTGSIKELQAAKFYLECQGMSTLNFSGKVEKFKLLAYGKNTIEAEKLEANSVDVCGNGFLAMEIQAQNVLQVSGSGMMNITYSGNPKITNEAKEFVNLFYCQKFPCPESPPLFYPNVGR
jgi:hypothetical protein